MTRHLRSFGFCMFATVGLAMTTLTTASASTAGAAPTSTMWAASPLPSTSGCPAGTTFTVPSGTNLGSETEVPLQRLPASLSAQLRKANSQATTLWAHNVTCRIHPEHNEATGSPSQSGDENYPDFTSNNWSGFVTNDGTYYNTAGANWTLAAADDFPSGGEYSSQWVGLANGGPSYDLIQMGTESDNVEDGECGNGYYLWFQAPDDIKDQVEVDPDFGCFTPGDELSTNVTETPVGDGTYNDQFTFCVAVPPSSTYNCFEVGDNHPKPDGPTIGGYYQGAPAANPANYSEIVYERTETDGQYPPLAYTGTNGLNVFTGWVLTDQATGDIDFNPVANAITMQDCEGATLATPGTYSESGGWPIQWDQQGTNDTPGC